MSGFNLPPGVTTSMVEDQISAEYYVIHRVDLAKLANICDQIKHDKPKLYAVMRRVLDDVAENPY